MCHNKILDFVSGRKATGIMPILLYAILLSVTPKKMTDDSELSYVMDVEKPCVDLYVRESSKGQRQREEKMKRKKKKKKGPVWREDRKKGEGRKTEVGGIIRIVFRKCGKKKRKKRKTAGVTSDRDFFAEFFIFLFSLLVFRKKWGKRCSHPIDFIVDDLTSSPLLASLSMNV